MAWRDLPALLGAALLAAGVGIAFGLPYALITAGALLIFDSLFD